jgi:thioredoxin 2
MPYSVIRTCGACGTSNRISAKHLSDTGRCGACRATLPPTSDPIEADTAAFTAIVNEAQVPILVDFWAGWCAPCRMAAPEVQALAREMAGKALVLKVDTEAQPELAARFRVQSIPNFVVIRDGQMVFQQPGLVRRDQMRQWLEVAGAPAA